MLPFVCLTTDEAHWERYVADASSWCLLLVSGLPKLSAIVSIVLWRLYFISYLRIPSSNVLSGYYFTWTSYVNYVQAVSSKFLSLAIWPRNEATLEFSDKLS